MSEIDSKFIVKSLQRLHSNCIYDTEVEGYSDKYSKSCRMDFLAIEPDLSNYIGYEIKTSRQDFLNDTKWHLYEYMCNSLYFICPKGVIKPDDLFHSLGLKYVYEDGSIRTIRKATYRKIERSSFMIERLLLRKFKYFEQFNKQRVKLDKSIFTYMESSEDDKINELSKYFKDDLLSENDSLRYQLEKLQGQVSDWQDLMDKTYPYYVEEALEFKKNAPNISNLKSLMLRLKNELSFMESQLSNNETLHLIISPSASGKTTLVNKLLEEFTEIKRVKTATTRTMREGESRNDYYFLTKDLFEEHREADKFAEHAVVYDNYYGTYKDDINDVGTKILITDIQGAETISKQYKCNRIFIDIPSKDELINRLKARKLDEDETNRRIHNIELELEYKEKCDYVVPFGSIDFMYSMLKKAVV